jgi:hypothetical protein
MINTLAYYEMGHITRVKCFKALARNKIKVSSFTSLFLRCLINFFPPFFQINHLWKIQKCRQRLVLQKIIMCNLRRCGIK